MSSDSQIYSYDGKKPFTLLKWKTRVGNQLFYNSVILSYKFDDLTKADGKEPLLKYKSNLGGTIIELLASEGDTVQPGGHLLKVQPCSHPVIMKDLCAECGADLRHLDRDKFAELTAAATFSMVHVVPELKVCLEQAEKLGRDDENRLLESRKLVLLVDLDQTLIHTTNDNVLQDLPDVYHFQLYGQYSPWYHTKLRPGTQNFLDKISNYFELHICTFGARLYAHKIAQILDPNGKLFSHRILSRDECFDANSKTGNLKALFPRGDHMVCIIDDREDVWNFAPNVVHVKPYCYFLNTGDINAPPFSRIPLNTSTASVTAGPEISVNVPVSPDLHLVSVNAGPVSLGANPGNTTANSICLNVNPGNADSKAKENSVVVQKEVASSKNSESPENENKDVKENSTGNMELKTLAKCNRDASGKSDASLVSEPTSGQNSSSKNCDISNKMPEESGLQAKEKTDSTKLDDFHDDYLLYLEEILENIHKKYYETYDKMRSVGKKGIPDLKVIVPDLRSKVLKGCNIVFSSVIPTNLVPETSRFWTLAESLGAEVTLELVTNASENKTTHVVGSKLGTAKVNAAKKHKDIFIVSVEWLLSCAERWERTDERLFPLVKDITPPFLDGNRSHEKKIENNVYDPVTGKSLRAMEQAKRTKAVMKKKALKTKKEEDYFSERIFVEAGLSLSQDDIEDMDREIEEACSDDSEQENEKDSSSSEESLSSEYPKGWKRPRKEVPEAEEHRDGEESSDADTIGSVDEEMAEAVKKEFGS